MESGCLTFLQFDLGDSDHLREKAFTGCKKDLCVYLCVWFAFFSILIDIPSGSDGEESACSVGELSLIPGLGRSLEEEMAIHPSILVWRIPWTEESGRL